MVPTKPTSPVAVLVMLRVGTVSVVVPVEVMEPLIFMKTYGKNGNGF